ncbi:MAG: DUF4394 domain-containing protein [Rhodanobacteraceae bacterium]
MFRRALFGVAVLLCAAHSAAAPAGGATILYVAMDVIGPGGRGDDCGSLEDSSVTANVGDHVHVCWFGQNNTGDDLTLHSISDDLDGALFTDFDLDIPAGQMQLLADFRITVKQTQDVMNTWVARAGAAGDPVTATRATHIEALQPTLLLDAALNASANPGEVVHGALTLTNTGTGDLAWHFGEADAPTAAPLMPARVGPPSARTISRGTPTIPAFAVEMRAGGNRLVSLDIAAPETPVVLPGTLPAAIEAGAFIDDDPSRELLLSDTDGLIAIDTTTGAVETINAATAPDSGDTGWLAMAWNPLDRALYALSTNGILPSLYSIDPATGETVRLGEINDRTLTINGVYTALAADSDGRMFAIDEVNDLLVAVARDEYSLPGRVSGYTVGPLGVDVDALAALAFDAATNTLYLSAATVDGPGIMYSVDTVTGAATPIGVIGGDGNAYRALAAVTSARPCGVAGDVSWVSLSSYIEAPLVPGAMQQVGVIFDATDLASGEYDANLCLHTNDARQRKVPIPVHLSVGANRDALFVGSFEGGVP